MHESRLVMDLVEEAVRVAEINGSENVHEMQVSIGALSHVTPLSLKSHLEDATKGTIIDHATFTIAKSTDPYSPDALDVRLVSMTVGEGQPCA
jgi:Zn finger protein HypA/HybF involved in hydrogenase expression